MGEHLRGQLPVQSSQEVLHLLVSWDFFLTLFTYPGAVRRELGPPVLLESRAVGLWRVLLWNK